MNTGYGTKLFLSTAILMAVLFVAAPAYAQDSLAYVQEENTPDWYVEPVIPAPLRAPRHAPAAACLADSVLTFNIDSVLTEVTVYDYDQAGHTTAATVWTCNADGLRTGKSKNEYGYTGSTQTMTAVYAWDANAAAWVGTEKSEFVYAGGRMTSNTSSVWLNGAWAADQRYTYAYDGAGNQTAYFELKRNTATNRLDSVKGWVRAWENGLQTIDAQYTAYANGKWTAGTKNEWAFDAEGTQTMTAVYTISNGKWVGTSKEEWGYTAGTLTMHATYGGWADNGWVGSQKEEWTFDGDGRTTLYVKYGWAAADWTPALQEENEYDGATLVRVENYQWVNGTKTGTKKELWSYTAGVLTAHELYSGWANNDWVGAQKEEYTFTSSNQPSVTTIYRWANGAWTGSEKEEWTYNASGKQTLHTKAAWADSDWTLTLKEETVYNGKYIVREEDYEWINGVKTGTKKIEYTYNSQNKKTLTNQYKWEENDWAIYIRKIADYDAAGNNTLVENYKWTKGVKTGTKKETYTYNASKQLTQTVTYAWAENDWTVATEENTTYAGANITSVENYSWTDGVKTGTKKEAYTYTSGVKTQVLTYQWYNNDWAYSTKEDWTFTSGKQTRYEKYGWNGLEWVDMQREIAAFDAAGNQILVENYALLTTTGWTGLKKEEYVFDGGTKTTTVTYAWTNGEWVYSTKNEAGYQDGNTAVSEANYTWNGTAWQGTGTRTETTTENGLLTELLTRNWPAGATEWTNATVTRNTYNADGENILTYNGTWNGTRWAVSSMTRLDKIIDSEGRQLLKASWQCGSDSVWKGIQKDTTKYSETGKMLYTARFKGWKNNDWVPVSKTENTYNADDKPLFEESYTWSSNKWQGTYRYEYKYDAQGRQTTYATYRGWNTTTNWWKGSSRQDVVYYKNYSDKYESTTTYSWKNNDWVPSMQNTYIYDSSEREIEHIVQGYSSSLKSWIYTNKYEKEYCGNKLVKDNGYAWSNNQWSIRSRKELYYDEDTQAKLRREILGTWTGSGVLMSFNDNHYMYSCDALTIRFVNYDGTLLETQEVNKGETPVYTGATPVRESNAEHTYTFAGWTPKIAPATGNVTYTATFTDSKNTYTVTWKNEDGSVIESETLEYGATPAHADIYKEKTAQYTYTFTGWTPGIGIVTGDAEYTATFDSIVNSYTINWLNADGSQINQMVTNYGEAPTAPADPTKESTAQYTYTFAGWTPEVETVTADATYTATFDSIVNSYTVNWLNADSSLLAQTTVTYGESPVYTGEKPSRPTTAEYTYTFAGWDKEIVPVEGDATYTATYDSIVNRYTVNWLNEDGSFIASETLEYGATPAHADITKEKTAEYTYTFAGWTPGIGIVTGNAEYTATFDSIVNSYTVTWLNEDGSVIESETLEYGATPAHADINKESTAEYTYTFAGWSPAIALVEGDATYQATFTATKRTYTINWLNSDNSPLAQTTVAYGESPVYTGEKPSRPTTAEYTYTFAGWSPEVTTVTGEATYTATYDSIVNRYTITWLNEDGSVIESETLEYGATPAHADIYKEKTAEYTYTFAGWSPAIALVEGDATYQATFTATKNNYTVTWLNEDGSIIASETLEYGATPAHADIVKENTLEWTYTFAGWSPAIALVEGDATYQATFTATKNSYTINWLNSDNSPLTQTTVAYGESPVYTGEKPSRPTTAEYTYTFAGWDKEIVPVEGDATYTATYDSVRNSYTVTFYYEDGVTVLDQVTVQYGETPATSLIPSKYSEEHYYYTFSGWSPEVVPAESNASYTATFTAVPKQYTVTFKNHNGRTLLTTETPYGEIPEYTGDEPTRTKDKQYTYTFSGWSPELTEVTGPTTYTAVFEGTLNQYTVIFLDEDGTELDRQTLDYGTMPVYEGETPTKDDEGQYGYTFKGWSPKLSAVSKHTTYRAVYTRYDKTQGIEDVQLPYMEAQKILIGNTIYILRGGKTYTLQGVEVR